MTSEPANSLSGSIPGEAFALLAAAMWAVATLLFGRLEKKVSPAAINYSKCLVAGVLLLITRVIVGGSALADVGMAAWVELSVSAVVGILIGDTCYFEAIQRIGVSRSILLLSTAPLFAAAGGVWFLGESLTALGVVGIVVTIVGLGVVAGKPSELKSAASGLSLVGVVFGFMAALGQASGGVTSKAAMAGGIDPLAAATFRLLVTVGILTIYGLFKGELIQWGKDIVAERRWRTITVASLLGTYCGMWFIQLAFARTSSSGVASALVSSSPLFAIPLAHLTGTEKVNLRTGIGGVLTTCGVVLLTLQSGHLHFYSLNCRRDTFCYPE